MSAHQTSEPPPTPAALIRCTDLILPLVRFMGATPSCVQPRYGRSTMLRRLGILADPILSCCFWKRLWREVIMGHPSRDFPELSRTSNLVLLLDPGAITVWPHPRLEPAPTLATVLAHWISRLRNPHLEIRAIPGLGVRTTSEIESAFFQEAHWRQKMLLSYGDKWPNIKVSDGRQPPMTFGLSLSDSAASRSLHRLVRISFNLSHTAR